MRTVFNNQMCAHVWAQLKQPHGHSRSMSFDGADAYSYQAHVATLQRLSETDQSQRVALFSSQFAGYSVSTTQHISLYRRAARQYPQFTVPVIKFRADAYQQPANHAANFEYLKMQYTDKVAELLRSPSDSYRLQSERVRDDLAELEQQLTRYCNAFKLLLPCPGLDTAGDSAAIIARRERLHNDPKRAAKREASRLARERAVAHKAEEKEAARIAGLVECEQQIANWRAGLPVRLPYGAQRAADGSAMLRVVGDQVETSLGAEAPLDHVKHVLRFYDIARARGGYAADSPPGRAPLVDVTLGHFRLDCVNSDGSIQAGCHYITAREIETLRANIGA